MDSTNVGRYLGQLMPIDDLRFPCVVMRKTCSSIRHYLGRLPADAKELAEYRKNCGMDPDDIYLLGSGRG